MVPWQLWQDNWLAFIDALQALCCSPITRDSSVTPLSLVVGLAHSALCQRQVKCCPFSVSQFTNFVSRGQECLSHYFAEEQYCTGPLPQSRGMSQGMLGGTGGPSQQTGCRGGPSLQGGPACPGSPTCRGASESQLDTGLLALDFGVEGGVSCQNGREAPQAIGLLPPPAEQRAAQALLALHG